MRFVICLLTIYVFFYSISYSNYEISENKNKFGGLLARYLGIFQLIFTNLSVFFLNR